jgi:hypothetical protein
VLDCLSATRDVTVCPGVVMSCISHDIGDVHVIVKKARKKENFIGQGDVCLLHPFCVGCV